MFDHGYAYKLERFNFNSQASELLPVNKLIQHGQKAPSTQQSI